MAEQDNDQHVSDQSPIIEPEQDEQFSDHDSELDELASSTESINSSILRFREENGRTYHSYKDGKYNFPNDESEQDRLDLQHHLFTLTFDGQLFTCPMDPKKQLHCVLDVGTGTGIWAIDFADEHPESQVLGIDLSPIQPSFVPPNVAFQIDDLEEDWTFASKFDFIYARMMTGSFTDFPAFFRKSFENLTNGGYIEIADKCFPLASDDGTLLDSSALTKWSNLAMEGTRKLGRPVDNAITFKDELEKAGFVNVVETRYKWPLNPWPKSPKFKQLGLWTHENIASGLEGLSMAILTRAHGWTKSEAEIFLTSVRKEMKDPKIHAYLPILTISGQKPARREGDRV